MAIGIVLRCLAGCRQHVHERVAVTFYGASKFIMELNEIGQEGDPESGEGRIIKTKISKTPPICQKPPGVDVRGKVQTRDADSRCANHTGYTSAERVNEWQRAISIFFFGGGEGLYLLWT